MAVENRQFRVKSHGSCLIALYVLPLICGGVLAFSAVEAGAQGYSELPPPLEPRGSYQPLPLESYASPSLPAAPTPPSVDWDQLEALAAQATNAPAEMGPQQALPLPQPAADTAVAIGNPDQLQAIAAGDLPLQEEHVAWYRNYPWLWLPMDGWTNSVEFGLNGTDGNSETTSIQTGADLERATETYTFTIDLNYQRTQSGSLETQNNGRLNADFDRLLGKSQWSAFTKLGLEYDEFKAFDLRLNINSGLGYYWVRTDQTTLATRFGAGTSKEIGGPDDSWVPEALFGLEASHQLTERQKVKAKLDYFPQWDAWSDYRMVTDVSWETLLDGVDNLSLKLAATNRYDSTPQGLKPNDLFYSALLLWKF